MDTLTMLYKKVEFELETNVSCNIFHTFYVVVVISQERNKVDRCFL